MNDAIPTCDDERRRDDVRAAGHLNGLDYLEVVPLQRDDPSQGVALVLYFLGKAPDLEAANVRIDGGQRIRGINVTAVEAFVQDDRERDDAIVVSVDRTGDFSNYTLRLVELDERGRPTEQPLAGVDPRYDRLTFNFKVDCPSDLDCKTAAVCPPPEYQRPEISYLAKDYASFRQLILDRLALIMPDWQERHVPDLGITLVELLAYAGDYLSYYQDAVATEAYLDTARQRISVRRHARLVDYAMHEGCSARAWVCVEASQDEVLDGEETYFITGYPGARADGRVLLHDDLLRLRPEGDYQVFEPLIDPRPYKFEPADLREPEELALRLKQGRDAPARSLPALLSPTTQALIAAFNPAMTASELLKVALLSEIERLSALRPGLPDDLDWLYSRLQAPEPAYPGDLEYLGRWIAEAYDPHADYLRRSLSPTAHRMLAAFDRSVTLPELLELALLDDLNRLLSQPSLYDEQTYGALPLSDVPTSTGRRLRGRQLCRRNRRLLEQAFPDEIRQSGKLYFYKHHNRISFYTWGNRECCLPRGATSATLRDDWEAIEQSYDQPPQQSYDRPPRQSYDQPPEQPPAPTVARKLRHLRPGDVLLFEELIGPRTGNPADADTTHRHAVRLTRVQPRQDELYRIRRLTPSEPATEYTREIEVDLPTPVVEIEWAPEDALPFPLCISAIGPAPECALIEDISVALGNVVLVDQGRRIESEQLGLVPIQETAISCAGAGVLSDTTLLAGRFAPRLSKGPLTFSQPLPDGGPATGLLRQDPRLALPWIWLLSPADPPIRTDDVISQPDPNDPQRSRYFQRWTARRDLLASHGEDAHFVVEMDDDGRAHLRFGDGELGMLPEAGDAFEATYRVGNGPSGNVGAESIAFVVLRRTRMSGVSLRPRNPLAAAGGLPPEPLDEVKLFAPDQFRTDLQRAITADDYAQLVRRDFKDQVQRAAATLRWTGSRYEVWVAIDPRGSETRDQALLDSIRRRLERYRRMGHDVMVDQARYVPLEIKLNICVKPHYLRGHVRAALLDLFSNRRLPDGRSGFFHSDRLTFGDGIYLSKLVAAAQAVPGVDSVQVEQLERRFEGPNGEIESGVLPFGPLDVARLDNDPSFPENGVLTLTIGGGR
jgi:hypothetical protein